MLFLAGWLLAQPAGWAWDGNWTDAASGRGDLFDDPGRSDGQAGTDPPQKFWIPDARNYRDVDPEELSDYFHRRNKDYAPYALARVTQALHYEGLVIPKGYYLIKPGDATDGSPRVNLRTLGQMPNKRESDGENDPPQRLAPIDGEPETPAVSQRPAVGNPPTEVDTGAKQRRQPPIYQTFVIIKQGKVVGVVPVHHIQEYRPAKGEKVPRRALAWVEWEDRRPALKFYHHKWVYTTEFQ